MKNNCYGHNRIRMLHNMINRKVKVAGLREATLFLVEGKKIQLMGNKAMRLFQFGKDPEEFQPGCELDFPLKYRLL